MNVKDAIRAIQSEHSSAELLHPTGMRSAHEGYAILLEEVEELWDEVKVKQSNRNLPKMKREAIQIGAMALRFLVDVIPEGTK